MNDNKKEVAPVKTSVYSSAKKSRKRLIIVIVSVAAALLLALIAFIIVRSVLQKRPPEMETVRARFEELITASAEINEIFWGEGLPTYPRLYAEHTSFKDTYNENGANEEKNIPCMIFPTEDGRTVVAYHPWIYFIPKGQDGGIYYDFEKNVTLSKVPEDAEYYRFAVREETPRAGEVQNAYLAENLKTEKQYYYYTLEHFDYESVKLYDESDDKYYDFVKENKTYMYVDDIRDAAAKVYGSAFLASVGGTIFDGIVTESGSVLYARYTDFEDPDSGMSYLMKDNRQKGYDLTDWEYDFSTMRMVDKSNATFVTVEVERWEKGGDGTRQTAKHTFVLENGQWYLDAATY